VEKLDTLVVTAPAQPSIEELREAAVLELTELVRSLMVGKMTQKQLAAKLNTSEPHISRVLNVSQPGKSADQLLKIACALGYKISFKATHSVNQEAKDALTSKLKFLQSSEISNQVEKPRPFKGLYSGRSE